MQANQQTRERRAYFRAGVDAFGGYSFVAALAAAFFVGLPAWLLELSAESTVVVMSALWMATGAVRFWLEATQERVDRLPVRVDSY